MFQLQYCFGVIQRQHNKFGVCHYLFRGIKMIDLDDLPKLPNDMYRGEWIDLRIMKRRIFKNKIIAEQPIFVSNLDGFNKNVIIKAHAKMMVGEYDD